MNEGFDKSRLATRALLAGAWVHPTTEREATALLDELAELVTTLGLEIVGRELIPLREIQVRFFVGSGKAEELKMTATALGADVIVFDNGLSPSQQRNWEKLCNLAVIDREEVILDIFARRARTHEARLQIELAKAQYALPRLTRAWGHLVRQGGGIGSKGEGESQLEQDKRRIRTDIDRLRRELVAVREARTTQRKDRKRSGVPACAIVGYTNAGKSSLLRRLTGADVLVENKLFATLDTTTRKVTLPNKQALLLTDTVGFVRNLPHNLVEAFKSTLEEAALADFLVQVLDASDPEVREHAIATRNVLRELGAGDQPMIVVLNKDDRVDDQTVREGVNRDFPEAISVSILNGSGVDHLLARMAEMASGTMKVRQLILPAADGERIARLHREAQVLETRYEADNVHLTVVLPPRLIGEFAPYLAASDDGKKADSFDISEAKSALLA